MFAVKGLGSVLIALATAAATSFFLTNRPDLEYSVPPTKPVGERAIYHVEIRPSGDEVKNLRVTVRFPHARIEENTLDGPLGLASIPEISGSKGVLDSARQVYFYSAPAVDQSDRLTLGFLVSSASPSMGEPEVDVRGDGVKATRVAPSRGPGTGAFLSGFGVGLAVAALWALIERWLRRRRPQGSRRGQVVMLQAG
ncbi:MAG: hypothetical protein ACRDJG_13010 [Actinomycetota bacterium]